DDPHDRPVRRRGPRPGAAVPRQARRRGLAVDGGGGGRPRRAHDVVVHGRQRRAGAHPGARRPGLRLRGGRGPHRRRRRPAARVAAPRPGRGLRRPDAGARRCLPRWGLEPDRVGPGACIGVRLGRGAAHPGGVAGGGLVAPPRRRRRPGVAGRVGGATGAPPGQVPAPGRRGV
ncbi:MAG: flavin reductase domain protein, FMN-binding, partial [uncultured Nocardioidaceae bacterium]